jgi:hypothetical protein
MVYENLLEANLKRNKTDSVMARIEAAILEQIEEEEPDATPEAT